MLSETESTLEEFMESSYNRHWLTYGNLHIYLRKNKARNAIDISNVTNVNRPNNMEYLNKEDRPQKTGLLDKLISDLVKLALKYNYEYIIVENILNDFLIDVLERRNFEGDAMIMKRRVCTNES